MNSERQQLYFIALQHKPTAIHNQAFSYNFSKKLTYSKLDNN